MISVILGDITAIATEAIVNSANPSLLSGGGVCGAIHKIAGPELEEACRAVRKIEPGQAIITPAFNLPAEYVIHAVAPRYLDGTRNEAATLKQTYMSICRIVAVNLIAKVTLPSLGTGIYRFPLSLAAAIACETLHEHLPANCKATIVCFDEKTLVTYQVASKLFSKGA